MNRVLLWIAIATAVSATGCYNHPFRQGYVCAPVYSQPTYTPPAAPAAVYAPPPCVPQAVQQCPCY